MYCWLHKVASSFWMWLFLWIKVLGILNIYIGNKEFMLLMFQEGKEPDPSKRPYVVQYSMKPKSATKYFHVVQNFSNIILGNDSSK